MTCTRFSNAESEGTVEQYVTGHPMVFQRPLLPARNRRQSRQRAAGLIIAKGALRCRTPIDLGQYLLDDPAAGLGSRYFQRRFAVEDCQIFAKPPVRLCHVAENIFSQSLDPREAHDPIG